MSIWKVWAVVLVEHISCLWCLFAPRRRHAAARDRREHVDAHLCLPQPALGEEAHRVVRDGDGWLFVLTRDADPVPMLTSAERRDLYGEASQDVVSGAGLGNWSRTTPGVFSSTDVSGRE